MISTKPYYHIVPGYGCICTSAIPLTACVLKKELLILSGISSPSLTSPPPTTRYHPPPYPTTTPHEPPLLCLSVCMSAGHAFCFTAHSQLTTHHHRPLSLTHSLTHPLPFVHCRFTHCRSVHCFVGEFVRSFVHTFVRWGLPSFLCLLQRTNGRTTNDQMNTNEGRPHTANIALLSGFVALLLRYLLSPPVRPFAHRNCDVVSLRCFVASLLRCSREQRRCAV